MRSLLLILAACTPVWGDDAKQKEAVAAIEKAGGQVEFRKEKDKIKVAVFFSTRPDLKDRDAALSHLKDLDVHYLSLGNDLSDAGLAHIKGLKSLEYLSCNGDRFTDAGLIHLET